MEADDAPAEEQAAPEETPPQEQLEIIEEAESMMNGEEPAEVVTEVVPGHAAPESAEDAVEPAEATDLASSSAVVDETSAAEPADAPDVPIEPAVSSEDSPDLPAVNESPVVHSADPPIVVGETVADSDSPLVAETSPVGDAAVEEATSVAGPTDAADQPPSPAAPEQTPVSEEAPAVVKDTTPARTPDRRRSSATSDAARRRSSAATDPARRRSSAAVDAEPPAIEVALTSARAVAGCPGRLEGKVSGRPRPIVGWTRDGCSVTADGERIRCYHEEDGTFGLEIAECRPEDAGLYEATATNAHGSAATDAQLELGDMSISGKEWAPDFTTPLLGGTFDEGGTIQLDTHVTGVPIPEITWSKDGVPLDEDDRVSPGFDSDKATLSVKEATTSDAGSYEITIRNKLGEVSSSVEVKIKKIYQAPVFIQQLTDVQQLLALDGKFSCKVSGIPAPDVQWVRNGEPIKSGRKCKIRRDGDCCTMTVRECEEEDAGTYTCRASNREATVDSTAQLQVVDKLERKPRLEAPLFLKTVGDCEVFPGMQARFTACVAGYPEPEAEWFRNDVRLYPSERVQMEADGSGLVRLTLRTVDETDTGRYRLTVRNSEGSVSCEADLTYDSFEIAPTKPLKDQYQTLEKELSSGIPTQLADPPIISKMVDRQLTLSWKPSATAGQRIPPTYIVEMAKMPDDDFTIVHHGVRGCSVEIKRLEPQCDYKFRVIAENKHGTSQPSPHVIAHRKDLVSPPEDDHPTLPEGETFRPGSSLLFPRGFDMEKHTGGRPHPPTFLRPESNLRYGVKARDVNVRWLVFGHPTPEVRVAFNNADLQIGGRYSLEFTSAGELTLTIESMQERDQGVYEALCTNKYGEARQRMILQQTEMPRFLLHPEETTVMQKDQARFEARIACATPPKIQWFKDWRPLKSTKRIRILWREPDTSILLVNDCLTPRDGGLYSVSATTASGTTSASAMLHIEYDEAAYSYISNSPARSVKPRSKAFEEFCDIGEELGRGTQGSVYHVVQRSNGCSFAAKAMNGKGDHRLYMNSEMWIMNQLHDRQLARLYDAYESPRQLILVQELCSGGDVLEALSRQPAYTESDVASVIHQVIWGLQYMHSKHIAHLGLTPGDILFLRPGGEEIKLIDFSLSRHINPERPERLDFGMPEFVAPEAVNGESVGLQADLWSVGIITYLLLSGTSPFRGDTDKETLERIQSGEMQFDLEAFSDVSDEAKDFISKLLVFPPAGRMDAKTALQHPWLKFAEKPPSGMKERPSEKLKLYTEKFRAWYRAASCRTWYRRRPFSAAFDHSSGMMYPPDVVYTPPPSPEPVRKELWVKPEEKEQEQEFSDEDELDWMGAESHYQQGPDTYLLQLRDIGLPSRLRQYIKVASERSPMFARRADDESFYDRTSPARPSPGRAGSVGHAATPSLEGSRRGALAPPAARWERASVPPPTVDLEPATIADGASVRHRSEPPRQRSPLPVWCELPVLHERRRYTDIMDEELDDERRSRISRYNADGGHYIPRRLRYELSARPKALVEAEAQKEQKAHGQFPFFREKPIDSAITEGQAHELTCLAIGNPKPIVQWFRNDVAIGETRRIRLLEDGGGRSVLRLQPAMDFDQGVYKAVCRNMVGQTVAKCRLYMGFEPGACDLPDVADFSATEVLLRWKIPADTGGSPVLAYALQYKALIDHEWTDVGDNIDHEFFCVGGLQPETNYHFRIKACNKFGWGSVSVPTPTVRTRKAEHWRRVEVSREERYLQQMTEAGRQPADPEALPELDYEAEENPVPLTPGSPEQRYTFLTEMHRGRFSLVAMCVNTENNQAYAAKLVEATEQSLEAAVAEYESLRSLRHERIAALFDAYKMDGKYVLVMEKLQGQDVLSFFADQHEYAEENVSAVVNQVLDGLQYLHWRGMAHLDLQPDNIVLSSHRVLSVKLVDLGSAQRVTRLGRMVRRSGSIEYTAPELLVDEPAFPMTDVWSLGCITYLLLSGTSPFLGADEDETRRNILYVRFRFDNLHKEITNEATRFMTMIFKRAPSKRPSCEECGEHRWLMSIEYMQKRRERAVFFGNRLKEYSRQYHQARERQATQNTDLIAAFTMDLIGAEPNL